jgi:hypothetical protein
MKSNNRAFFEVWGESEVQNYFLKWVLIIFTVVVVAQSASLLVISFLQIRQAKSDGSLIPGGSSLKSSSINESDIKRALERYLQLRYSWDLTTIEEQLPDAAVFLIAAQKSDFLKTVRQEVARARRQNLAQRFFVERIQIDEKTKTATVEGWQLLLLSKSALPPRTTVEKISYELGGRTPANPEGVYVLSEKPLSKQLENGKGRE